MLGRTVGATISCALAASAFLLPPGVSTSSKNAVIPFETDGKSQLVELPCSSCAFAVNNIKETQETEDDVFWIQGGANNLLLNFTISQDGKSLLLDGSELYPQAWKDVKTARRVVQIPVSTTREDIASGKVEGTSLEVTGEVVVQGEKLNLDEDNNSIIPIRWQIMSLEGQDLPVDQVAIQLLSTDEGELLILAIEPIPGSAAPVFKAHKKPHFEIAPPKPPHKGCKFLPGPLCDFGHFVNSKIGGFGKPGCTGRPGPHGDGHLPSHIRPPFGEHDKALPEYDPHGPPHDRPHGHPHGRPHHRSHGFFHSVIRMMHAVLVPVMAGIAVGMLVSITGLLFGRFVGWLWFTVMRGGSRCYNRVATDEIAIIVTDADKEVLVVEHSEPLPLYEDAPAYEEVEKAEQ